MADGGVVRQLTVLGDAPGGDVARLPVTVLVNNAVLQLRTATGDSPAQDVVIGEVTLPVRVATGVGESGTTAEGAVTLALRTVFGSAPDVATLIRETISAAGTALNGTIGDGAAVLLNRAVSGTAVGEGLANGAVTLQPRTSAGFGAPESTAQGAVSLRRRQVFATHIGGTVGSASVSFRPRTVSTFGNSEVVGSGLVTRPMFRTNGFGQSAITQTYRTWVTNMANEALTEYSNFKFNSYAYFNNKYYAAGPEGLYTLEGNTDNNVGIEWSFRTGMMDDKKTHLKNLHEVLMGIRFNGPIRVRVYTDEETFYNYTVTSFRDDRLHQIRVKCGKGLRSRYFQIEFTGMNGSSCEIDSVQIPMEPVTRRAG